MSSPDFKSYHHCLVLGRDAKLDRIQAMLDRQGLISRKCRVDAAAGLLPSSPRLSGRRGKDCLLVRAAASRLRQHKTQIASPRRQMSHRGEPTFEPNDPYSVVTSIISKGGINQKSFLTLGIEHGFELKGNNGFNQSFVRRLSTSSNGSNLRKVVASTTPKVTKHEIPIQRHIGHDFSPETEQYYDGSKPRTRKKRHPGPSGDMPRDGHNGGNHKVKEAAASIGCIGRDTFLQSLMQKNNQYTTKPGIGTESKWDDGEAQGHRAVSNHAGARRQRANISKGHNQNGHHKRPQQKWEKPPANGYPHNVRHSRPREDKSHRSREDARRKQKQQRSFAQPDFEDEPVNDQGGYDKRSYRIEDDDQTMPPHKFEDSVAMRESAEQGKDEPEQPLPENPALVTNGDKKNGEGGRARTGSDGSGAVVDVLDTLDEDLRNLGIDCNTGRGSLWHSIFERVQKKIYNDVVTQVLSECNDVLNIRVESKNLPQNFAAEFKNNGASESTSSLPPRTIVRSSNVEEKAPQNVDKAVDGTDPILKEEGFAHSALTRSIKTMQKESGPPISPMVATKPNSIVADRLSTTHDAIENGSTYKTNFAQSPVHHVEKKHHSAQEIDRSNYIRPPRSGSVVYISPNDEMEDIRIENCSTQSDKQMAVVRCEDAYDSSKLETVTKATILMQKHIRGWQCRRTLELELDMLDALLQGEEVNMDAAASTIQRFFVDVQRRQHSITNEAVLRPTEDIETPTLHRAAVSIQTHMRGWRCRRDLEMELDMLEQLLQQEELEMSSNVTTIEQPDLVALERGEDSDNDTASEGSALEFNFDQDVEFDSETEEEKAEAENVELEDLEPDILIKYSNMLENGVPYLAVRDKMRYDDIGDIQARKWTRLMFDTLKSMKQQEMDDMMSQIAVKSSPEAPDEFDDEDEDKTQPQHSKKLSTICEDDSDPESAREGDDSCIESREGPEVSETMSALDSITVLDAESFSKYCELYASSMDEDAVREQMMQDQIAAGAIEKCLKSLRSTMGDFGSADVKVSEEEVVDVQRSRAASASALNEMFDTRHNSDGNARFEKYTKMGKMGMPSGAVKHKMEVDGMSPEDIEDCLSLMMGDQGVFQGETLPLVKKTGYVMPAGMTKYKNMFKVGMSDEVIVHKMKSDGVDTKEILQFMESLGKKSTKALDELRAETKAADGERKGPRLKKLHFESVAETSGTIWEKAQSPLAKSGKSVKNVFGDLESSFQIKDSKASKGQLTRQRSSSSLGRVGSIRGSIGAGANLSSDEVEANDEVVDEAKMLKDLRNAVNDGTWEPDEILEPATLRNVGIMLAKFGARTPIDKITMSILNMDGEKLSAQSALEVLKGFSLNTDSNAANMKKVQDYVDTVVSTLNKSCSDGDRPITSEEIVSKLTRPDQFFARLQQVPRLEHRIMAMDLQHSFSDEIKSIRADMETILKACSEVRESTNLQDWLALILDLGNELNASGNSQSNGSTGFRISEVAKLVETKTNQGMTLLEYILTTLKNDPDLDATHCESLLYIFDDFPSAPLAAVRGTQSFTLPWSKLQKSLLQLAVQVKAAAEEGDNVFVESVTPFLSLARGKLASVQMQMDAIQEKYAELCAYVGENPKTLAADQLFGMLISFLERLKATNQRVVDKIARQERAKRQSDSPKTKSRKGQSSYATHKKSERKAGGFSDFKRELNDRNRKAHIKKMEQLHRSKKYRALGTALSCGPQSRSQQIRRDSKLCLGRSEESAGESHQSGLRPRLQKKRSSVAIVKRHSSILDDVDEKNSHDFKPDASALSGPSDILLNPVVEKSPSSRAKGGGRKKASRFSMANFSFS